MTRQVDMKSLVSHILRADGLDKCRICMGDTTDGLVHLTDTVMMDGDKAVTLSELLEILTGVQMEREEALPSGVCARCSGEARAHAAFRALVCGAARRWARAVRLLRRLPAHRPAPASDTLVAVLTADHIHVTDENTNPPAPPPAARDAAVVRRFGKRRDCKCPTCGKEFKYALLLHKHLKESADLRRACHVCGDVMSRADLVRHLRETHDLVPYACKKCPALYLSAAPYRAHRRGAHAAGAPCCGDCGRALRSLPALHAHRSVHARRACPNCDRPFQNQTCYTHHVKECCKLDSSNAECGGSKLLVKLKDREVRMGARGSTRLACVCDLCQKVFADKKSVAAHLRAVHSRGSHAPCARCGKLFPAARMAAHVASHAARAFPCAHCGAVLRSRLGLRQHERRHTGERPYRCAHCGEAFSASSRRSEHVRARHAAPGAASCR